jgi:hypothetical protein
VEDGVGVSGGGEADHQLPDCKGRR